MPQAANLWAPTIAASNAHRVQRFALSRGIEPRRLGRTPARLEVPDARVPARQMFQLWGKLAEALDSSVAIQVAEASSLEDLQLLGFTLTTAPSVREGLAAFLQFSPLLSDAFAWSLSCKGPALEVRWHSRVAVDPGVRVSLETSMAQFVKGIRQLAGDDVDPLRVCIGHPAPPRAAVHRAFFRCPLEFDAASYRVLYPRHVLEVTPRQANRALWMYLRGLAEDSVAQLSPQPMAVRVRDQIAASLEVGRVPRLRELAERLGVSERNLRRMLAADGISFRELVDRERRARARDLLANPSVSITRAALELGFADGSALAHACQRWFARRPGDLRQG